MNDYLFFPYSFDLQMFADGAGEAGASAGEAAGQAEPAAESSADTETTGVTHDAGADAAEAAAKEDRAEEYKRFKKDYKSEFDAEVQDILRRRMRKSAEFESKVNGLVQTLADKYGGKADDIDSLLKAVEQDDSFYEEAAMEKGLTVEQYKEFRKMERENKAFHEAAREQEKRRQAESLYSTWQNQSESTKQLYKGFNLDTEIQNPEFTKLLRSGVDVKTAYEVIHKDEIIPAAMQLASQKTAQKISAAVASNSARPVENGLSSPSSALSAPDISKLTKAQMEDM